MFIKILGPGCANCHTLEKLTRHALAELNLTAEVTSVTDYPTIAAYGVMTTPALVIDDRVVLSGRIPTVAQVRDLLTAAHAAPAGTPDGPDDLPRIKPGRARTT